MTNDDICVLNENVDKTVKIKTFDGEILIAKIILVSMEDEDIICDLVSTNKPSLYKNFDSPQSAYLIKFAVIESVESVTLQQAGGPPLG